MKLFRLFTSKQSTKRLKVVINLALPSSLNSLLDILVIGICLFLMGKIDDNHLLAVSISLSFYALTYAFTTIFYVGTNTQIARLYGAKMYDKIPQVVKTMIIGGFLASLPITLFAIIGSFYYFKWLNLSEEANLLAIIL